MRSVSALLLSILALATSECPHSLEFNIGNRTKVVFEGFQPIVNRFMSEDVENKIMFKDFDYDPIVSFNENIIEVKAGDSCLFASSSPKSHLLGFSSIPILFVSMTNKGFGMALAIVIAAAIFW